MLEIGFLLPEARCVDDRIFSIKRLILGARLLWNLIASIHGFSECFFRYSTQWVTESSSKSFVFEKVSICFSALKSNCLFVNFALALQA